MKVSIVEVAEFISAFAAFLTVSLAFLELGTRSKLKREAEATNQYVDYRLLEQEINLVIVGLDTLNSHWEQLSLDERKAYAKTNAAPKTLFSSVQTLEKELLNSVLAPKKHDLQKNVMVLSCSCEQLLLSANSIYQLVLDTPNLAGERLNYFINNVHVKLLALTDAHDAVSECLRRRLKPQRWWHKVLYPGIYFGLSALFLLLFLLLRNLC